MIEAFVPVGKEVHVLGLALNPRRDAAFVEEHGYLVFQLGLGCGEMNVTNLYSRKFPVTDSLETCYWDRERTVGCSSLINLPFMFQAEALPALLGSPRAPAGVNTC